MRTPKPIKVNSPAKLELSFAHGQYLYIETPRFTDVYGYIEEKDVKRLKAWCEKIIDQKKRKR